MELPEFEKYVEQFWDVDQEDSLFVMTAGLGGESGEVEDILKKWVYKKRHVLDREHLCEEIGDTLYYLVKIAHEFGIPMSEIMEYNVWKCKGRGYGSVQASSEEPAVRGWEG